jgi:hypothetical protein
MLFQGSFPHSNDSTRLNRGKTMAVSIYKKSRLLANYGLFILVSPFFLHVVRSLNEGVSSLDLSLFVKFLASHKIVFLMSIISYIFVIRAKKISYHFLEAYFIYLCILCVSIFFDQQDKIILLMIFSFIVSSFLFYIFLRLELKEAIYNPGFNKNEISAVSDNRITLKIVTEKKKIIKSYLTNWGKNSCFVRLCGINDKINGKVVAQFEFEGKKFAQLGELVTSYGDGYGILFYDEGINKKEVYQWSDLYTIICDRGLKPSLEGENV